MIIFARKVCIMYTFYAYLDQKDEDTLRASAKLHGVTMNEIIREALELYRQSKDPALSYLLSGLETIVNAMGYVANYKEPSAENEELAEIMNLCYQLLIRTLKAESSGKKFLKQKNPMVDELIKAIRERK